MDSLLRYINSLPKCARDVFASKCGTTIGYLRNAASAGKLLGEKFCIAIERESDGAVKCEDLRPDVDWAYLRGTSPTQGAPE